ncbi:MAG: 6 7-dimethyl-8-ribityllumazine synthase [Candidatus Saganbacteria bacterium]|uniref:6,7-dimethyl-8-ribityllumazine synthase n=1 Tax=Candidatus Saganbacteria bacterium TaxID=2575572 RepID=A0A833L077_UNCSA|nr:MAG: 6 7-dimethyl-8-ribityllumazine synthase [Candidatus Saganbacteria bacterium]
MAKTFEGSLVSEKLKFGIVVSRFNELVSRGLLEGALDCLRRHGATDSAIDIAWVPGSFEIPFIAKKMAASKKYDAIICLGAVIRGATSHFEYVAAEVSKGIAKISLDLNMPIIFGVLTCDTLDQALERAGAKPGNKGFSAALSAIELANLSNQL